VSEGAAKKEEKPRKFQAIRGTRDLLPSETALWNSVEQSARETFGRFGFKEIRVPIFEPTGLFARSIGVETDVISKEMYTFEDKAGGLPNPRDVAPAEYVAVIERAMQTGQIPTTTSNQSVLAVLKQQAANFELRSDDPERAHLIWTYLAGSLQLGESISLRPEATASVCRAYIEHGMQSWPQPVKLYYMGPMFRRERPQKGRYRQFHQIGAEVLEAVRPDAVRDVEKELAKDATIDADVIEMLMTFFDRVGLQGMELKINSIGHAAENCRHGYVELLRDRLREVKEQLGADSQRRIETNPLRVLDSKIEHEQPIIAKLPHIADYLCNDCKTHYTELKQQLDRRGIKAKENWRLVRGLDYYMRTTFEITAGGLGSQDAVCGGGRYDGLVEILGGPPTKGIGFAIGEDRLIMSLQSQGIEVRQGADVLIAWQDQQAQSQAQALASLLRGAGLSVVVPSKPMGPGQGIGLANKLGIPLGAVIGSHEANAGIFTIKIMSEGTQMSVPQSAATEVGRLLLFRILLEKSLSKIAANNGLSPFNRPVLSILEELTAASLVPADLAELIKSALRAFNRIAHGEDLTQEERTTAISQALFVLYRMSVFQMTTS